MFKTILNWIPTDTETLVVTKGPYQIEVRDEDNPRRLPLMKYLEGISYSPLGNARKGGYLKKLQGQEIALAVEGARAFRSPKSLGLWPYEGCHILVFSRELGATGDALRKAWRADAVKVHKIEGHDVYSFEQKLEEDVWKFFFAQPAANVLLCATDQQYITELLKRMERPGEKRAFPDDLPEWKHADINARCWAIRHYGKPREVEYAEAPLSVDPQAVGLAFNYTPNPKEAAKTSVSIKYLSASKRAREIATKAWTYFDQPKWRPTVRQSAPGVVDVTAEFEQERAREFLFLLLFHLGHMINV
jgi:hypothetical protein